MNTLKPAASQQTKTGKGDEAIKREDMLPNRLPTDEDMAEARKYDVGYGQSTYPGGKGRVTDFESFKDWLKSDTFDYLKVKDFTPSQKRNLETAFVAVKKNPIATIGFDPAKLVQLEDADTLTNPMGAFGPNRNKKADVYNASGKKVSSIDIGGKDTDTMYSAQIGATTTVIHESIHRGFEEMRRAGVKGLPQEGREEEIAVRALMLKHYGNAEWDAETAAIKFLGVPEDKAHATPLKKDSKIGQGYKMLKDRAKDLERWEDLAQAFLAKQRSGRRGPA